MCPFTVYKQDSHIKTWKLCVIVGNKQVLITNMTVGGTFADKHFECHFYEQTERKIISHNG
jgi:hypothetical protein